MKKLVNGKVVNVDNIALFELAAEGLALQNTAISSTNDGIEGNIDSPLVRKYIKQYDVFFKSMPYPLYAIEADIKYATLGNFIKFFSKTPIHMWVNEALYIMLDSNTGMTLKIINNTWSIVYEKQCDEDNTSMGLYKDSIGYKEYSWILSKITHKETTADFYTEFMPEFVKACNNQPIILKWELENMLTFSSIPNKIEFKQNKVVDIDAHMEYTLDIFCTGYVDTDEKIQTWNLTGEGKIGHTRYKQIKTYGYDAYQKSTIDGANKSSKLEKCKVTGLNNLFMQLCGIKSATEASSFPNFEGVISGTNLVFTIEKRLFIAKSNRLSESKAIANGVELYSIEGRKAFFVKSKRINDKISKDSLYSYNITDESIRLCKTLYTY